MIGLGLGSVAVADVDESLPSYQKSSGVSGKLSSVGSDTLANLMTLWTEHFGKKYPKVQIQVQAAGSSTAPPALTEGTSSFGPMSRQMKDKEIQAFEEKYGYKPTAIPVAIDALAVFVHKDNPVKGLTLPQVDAVFSANSTCGYEKNVKSWGDLEIKGSLAKKDIQLYGRNSVSGTYGYFKEVALCDGDFKNTVNEQPGSAAVVLSVTESPNAIGYSGMGYRTAGVKAVPLATEAGGEFVEANGENALSGDYPLARALYVYVNKKPNEPLAPLEREFVKLMLSKEGQEVVVKDGYVPLTGAMAEKALQSLDINNTMAADK